MIFNCTEYISILSDKIHLLSDFLYQCTANYNKLLFDSMGYDTMKIMVFTLVLIFGTVWYWKTIDESYLLSETDTLTQ